MDGIALDVYIILAILLANWALTKNGRITIKRVENPIGLDQHSTFSLLSAIARHAKIRVPFCLLLTIIANIVFFIQFGNDNFPSVFSRIYLTLIGVTIETGITYVMGSVILIPLGTTWLFLTGSPHDRPFKKEPSKSPKIATAMRIVRLTIEGLTFTAIAYFLYVFSSIAQFF